MKETTVTNGENNINIEEKFFRKGTLTRSKLLEYIPVMILTNMSVFILSTVDGLVAGNLVSADALGSISIFGPVLILLSVISVLVSAGSATSLSTCMGKNDVEQIGRTKSAIMLVMILAVVATAVVEYPMMHMIVDSYDLTAGTRKMVWEYAIGLMIAMPIGVITSVGSYQLQILGRMKILMVLSLTEAVLNVIMDLFFVVVVDLGVVGIGLGTAVANVVRCSITLIYLAKKTDMFNFGRVRPRLKEVMEILSCGLPDAAQIGIIALQNYFMLKIILYGFGDVGGVIRGVCFFAYNIANIVNLGLQSSMRPLAGLLAGAEDHKGIRNLMNQGIMLSIGLVGIITVLVLIFPEFMYHLHGVTSIPEGGTLAIRLYSLYFVFLAVDAMFRLYLTNRKDTRFTTGLIIGGNATMPFFAFALLIALPGPFLWLSYLITELLLFVIYVHRYRKWIRIDLQEDDPSEVLYLSVTPEDAVEASRSLRNFADEHEYPEKIAYRMALCMEEMVAYAVESQKTHDIQIQIMARFSEDEGTFFMLDDGRCIALNNDEETKDLVTDNYELIKRVAKSVEYQYILNMNYTLIRL